MQSSSAAESGPVWSRPRLLALLGLLAAAIGFVFGQGNGASPYEELQALRLQGTGSAPSVQNPEPIRPPRTAEDYIRASGLVAYDVAAAAQMLEQDRRGDLFDCYASMFLPRSLQAGHLEAIRKAIGLLDAVPQQDRDYRYHIKMAYCQFYRFVLIPVLHQRASGETNLPGVQLQEAGASFDAALEHAERAGDALSGVLGELQATSALVQGQPGKYDSSKLNAYFVTKRPLIRQIL